MWIVRSKLAATHSALIFLKTFQIFTETIKILGKTPRTYYV